MATIQVDTGGGIRNPAVAKSTAVASPSATADWFVNYLAMSNRPAAQIEIVTPRPIVPAMPSSLPQTIPTGGSEDYFGSTPLGGFLNNAGSWLSNTVDSLNTWGEGQDQQNKGNNQAALEAAAATDPALRDTVTTKGLYQTSKAPRGFYMSPVYGSRGQLLGYNMQKIEGFDFGVMPEPNMVIDSPTQSDYQKAAQNRSFGSAKAQRLIYDDPSSVPTLKTTPENIYQEVQDLLNSRGERKYLAAVQTWGDPTMTTDDNGNTIPLVGNDGAIVWGGNAGSVMTAQYLGLNPGEIASRSINLPKPDAPLSEWIKVRNQLKREFAPPRYTENSVGETLWNIGKKGVTSFQKDLIKAGYYNPDESFAYGLIGEEERKWMKKIMAYGNVNGLEWTEALSILVQAGVEKQARDKAAEDAASSGGGGGGGTSVYTQTQFNQTSMAQGRSTLVNVLRDALGRYPTDDELRQFMRILNSEESKKPSVSTTTTTSADGNTSAVTNTTPSSVNAEAMALDFAQEIRGGKAYQANQADKYMSALMQSLGG